MKWEELTPRQRDGLVAEKLFNYTVDWEFDEPSVAALRDQYDEWGILPFYTTDMSAAMLVGEQVKTFTLVSPGAFIPPGEINDSQWRCTVWWQIEATGGYTYKAAKAPTAPEALCLAALRAKGVEV